MADLLLIDGNSLAYRAFYALQGHMYTTSGQATNAVYGFVKILLDQWRECKPKQIVITFDLPKPTFRHKITPDYKATRQTTPDSLIKQMSTIKDVLKALALPIVEKAGYEADDLIATLATQGRDAGLKVLIDSGDQDIFQLVEDPFIQVFYRFSKSKKADHITYDEAGVRQRTGVTPADYVLYAALRGDKSDNLPGVPGVGDKTAAKLVNEKRTLNRIYTELDTITSPRLRENLANAEQRVRRNVELMQLVREVPLDKKIEDLQKSDHDKTKLIKLFDDLEFRTLRKPLAEVLGVNVNDYWTTGSKAIKPKISVVDTAKRAVRILTDLRLELLNRKAEATTTNAPLAMAMSADGLTTGLALVVDSTVDKVQFIAGELLYDTKVVQAFNNLVASTSTQGNHDSCQSISKTTVEDSHFLAMHDAKAMMRALLDHGIDIRVSAFDTMLAGYLLDPSAYSYKLSDLAPRYANLDLPSKSAEATAPTEGQCSFDLDNLSSNSEATTVTTAIDDAAWSALAVNRLETALSDKLETEKLDSLYNRFEMPLMRVLARMEHIGIKVDEQALQRIRGKLTIEAEELREKILSTAEYKINVNSPKQLSKLLFEDLGLTPPTKRRTKTGGLSTDAQTLEKLRSSHKIVDYILKYREAEKLRSTYGEGLLKKIGGNGRIHAKFNQTVARTGRLSSDDPNLHNIPVRTARGREFRAAFTAPEDSLLIVADYDQIELRCIAHLSQDERLIAAFESEEDVHTTTAAWLFDITPEEVDLQKRATAKMVSYGLIYGMEAHGLGTRLNLHTSEAAKILETYFSTFPGVRAYIDRTIEEARERGYTKTLFGRRRQIPELRSPNRRRRQAGERQAISTCVQGLAADIFKMALIRLDDSLETKNFKSRIVLQVHDEIILETPIHEVEEVSKLVSSVMRGVSAMPDFYKLDVHLDVHLKAVRTWADSKTEVKIASTNEK
ncbi:MAG: DNA polymerase I [Acidimicrobiaceae bacterium]|nr:DNA polymerase I [Acidimicrobiaceae bacterium]